MALNRFAEGDDDSSDEDYNEEYAQGPRSRGPKKKASDIPNEMKKATAIPKGSGSKVNDSSVEDSEEYKPGSNNASSKYFTCRGTLNSDALEVFEELSCSQLIKATPKPPKPIEVII